MKNDLERLQFLTRNHNLLLRGQIVLGLLYLVKGLAVLILGTTARLNYGWLFFPTLVLLMIGASRYNQQKFGTVRTRLPRRAYVALAVMVVLYFVLLGLGGNDFKNLKVALEPTLLNGALMMILLGLLPGFPWRHYVAFGLLLAGIAFLPGLQIMSIKQFYRGWTFIIIGGIFIACGVVDRLILAHHRASLKLQESHG